MRSTNVKTVKRIALERIYILFGLGVNAARRGDIGLARRYGELIYRIATRVRVKIPRNIKRWICKECRAVMVPGVNAMVRTRREGKTLRIVTRCLSCGWIHRYEFLRRSKYG
uniref:Ribonuclease P protein component 4 n=1 Tax=Ignisphaera aggregans TaxID=334771 RepID=A0A7C2ZMZ5_9CREN